MDWDCLLGGGLLKGEGGHDAMRKGSDAFNKQYFQQENLFWVEGNFISFDLGPTYI